MKFREKVLKIVSEIPKGKVLTYKRVTELAKNPRAFRAVGNILNMNNKSYSYNYVTRSKHKRAFVYPSLAIIKRKKLIPCHRVIKSDGKVGGYNRGVKQKILLLRKEGVKLKGNKIVR